MLQNIGAAINQK